MLQVLNRWHKGTEIVVYLLNFGCKSGESLICGSGPGRDLGRLSFDCAQCCCMSFR